MTFWLQLKVQAANANRKACADSPMEQTTGLNVPFALIARTWRESEPLPCFPKPVFARDALEWNKQPG